MSTRLFVTGASGFIGTHCIIDLLNHGYQVKGAIRDMDRTDRLYFLLKILSFFDGSVTPFLADLELKKEMDISPARDLLGWTPRSPEEAIESGARSLIDLDIV
jgi:thioester reductase-like protein